MRRRCMVVTALTTSLLMLTGCASQRSEIAAATSPTVGARMAMLYDAYDTKWKGRLVPLLAEVIRFPTTAGNDQAFADQKSWLARVTHDLGLTFRDEGKVIEVELPGPVGAPVLGLVVHGDIVPVDDHWIVSPFAGVEKDGMVIGRGSADDKGPLVQALLAMATLREDTAPRTHTIRLLIGSDEESGSTDMKEYLRNHAAPDFTLVLDAYFPVVVGERAWNALTVDAALKDRQPSKFRVASMRGGLAASIVPDSAVIQLERTPGRNDGATSFANLRATLAAKPLPKGTRIETQSTSEAGLQITAIGKAAHSGVNPAGGRNAIVALASAVADELPEGGARDLLAFAQLAGQDLSGTGLGLTQVDPSFGRVTAVPTLLRAQPDGRIRLLINIRSNPILSGEALTGC